MTISVSNGERYPEYPRPKMNMIRNGPRMRLASTPGRRSTSRSSLPVNEAIRMMLWRTLRIRQSPLLAAVRLVERTRRAPLLHEAGEDLVERRLMLLEARHGDPRRLELLDNPGGQGRGILHGHHQLTRRSLPNRADALDRREQVRVDRSRRVDLE